MSEVEIDVQHWYGERFINYKPVHFVLTNTQLTDESTKWIVASLKGRWCICYQTKEYPEVGRILDMSGYPAFEDPNEAIFYELKWS